MPLLHSATQRSDELMSVAKAGAGISSVYQGSPPTSTSNTSGARSVKRPDSSSLRVVWTSTMRSDMLRMRAVCAAVSHRPSGSGEWSERGTPATATTICDLSEEVSPAQSVTLHGDPFEIVGAALLPLPLLFLYSAELPERTSLPWPSGPAGLYLGQSGRDPCPLPVRAGQPLQIALQPAAFPEQNGRNYAVFCAKTRETAARPASYTESSSSCRWFLAAKDDITQQRSMHFDLTCMRGKCLQHRLWQ